MRYIHNYNMRIIYLKAQFNFSSGVPELVTLMANKNSLKSINPLLSVSNVLKM